MTALGSVKLHEITVPRIAVVVRVLAVPRLPAILDSMESDFVQNEGQADGGCGCVASGESKRVETFFKSEDGMRELWSSKEPSDSFFQNPKLVDSKNQSCHQTSSSSSPKGSLPRIATGNAVHIRPKRCQSGPCQTEVSEMPRSPREAARTAPSGG